MKNLLFLVVYLLGINVFSAEGFQDFRERQSDDDFRYDNYFVIRQSRQEKLNLLALDNVGETLPYPDEAYKRDVHFGGWLRDKQGGTCLNTRGLVLVRDSVVDVEYTSNGCTVASGQWDEPYTGSPHFSARDIQIDHIVALKNAYMSGAFEWDFKKRCLYANYMGNEFHLLSVDGPQNMRKGDCSPSAYIPPNRNYTCQYLKQWLFVKLIWSLRLTPKEATAIKRIAQANSCDEKNFEVTQAELAAQRRFMKDNANLCSGEGVSIESF